MTAYYNEHDKYAAQWLRNLIDAGEIAPGDVDERDIREVRADDLRGYEQVHFFAGVGGWSAALRLAGWPDDVPVWSGSCPCQPFSSAGKQKGTADERHLWPEMLRLVSECRPDCVFGEQVPGAIRHGWLDGISADLEAEDYAVGAIVLGAHSVGAPHIRQRLFWVADRSGTERERWAESERKHGGTLHASDRCGTGWVADSAASEKRDSEIMEQPESERVREVSREGAGDREPGNRGAAIPCGGCGNSDPEQRCLGCRHDFGLVNGQQSGLEGHAGDGSTGDQPGRDGAEADGSVAATGLSDSWVAHTGHEAGSPEQGVELCEHGTRSRESSWSDFHLVHCRDGKTRRISAQSCDEPLALSLPRNVGSLLAGVDGVDTASIRAARSNRVGRLKGYGNAIVVPLAAEFVAAYLET